MEMPYGKIDDKVLRVEFSSADFSVASVLAAVRERRDKLEEMGVVFLGTATEVPAGPTPVFRPVAITAIFEHVGEGPARTVLEKAYLAMWNGIVVTFPAEPEWAEAKRAYAQFISSQADLLRARTEATAP